MKYLGIYSQMICQKGTNERVLSSDQPHHPQDTDKKFKYPPLASTKLTDVLEHIDILS